MVRSTGECKDMIEKENEYVYESYNCPRISAFH
jgi:hypothetical protein